MLIIRKKMDERLRLSAPNGLHPIWNENSRCDRFEKWMIRLLDREVFGMDEEFVSCISSSWLSLDSDKNYRDQKSTTNLSNSNIIHSATYFNFHTVKFIICIDRFVCVIMWIIAYRYN